MGRGCQGVHFCDFGNYRIVIRYFRPYYYGLSSGPKNEKEGRPKTEVSVIHSEDESDCQKVEIDTSKHPRYKTLIDQLFALVAGDGFLTCQTKN